MNSKTITPTPYDLRRSDSDAPPLKSLICMTCVKDIRPHAVFNVTEEHKDKHGVCMLGNEVRVDALSLSQMLQQFQNDVFIER